MPESSTLGLFTVTALLLLITPGPAVLYIVARSIHQGRLAGVSSTLGLATGTLFHIAAAALGLSAILLSSALAFEIVKYLGAAYLMFLGVSKLLSKDIAETQHGVAKDRLGEVYLQGIIVNILNPKTALFFFAFLPQFLDPAAGSVVTQVLILGFLFVVLGILTDSFYAFLSGSLSNLMRRNPKILASQRYFAGTVYIGLGVTTALAGKK